MRKQIAIALLSFPALFAQEAGAQTAQTREPLPLEQLRILAGAYQLLRSDYVTELDGPELIRHAIRGMIRAADPEAGEYYVDEEFKILREGAKPGEAPIGAELRLRDGQMVLAPLGGGPAARAGVRLGDVLHAVDGRRVSRLQVHEILPLLRGPEGTQVTLTVFRESSLTVETVTVERRAMAEQVPVATRPAPGVLLLRIPAFQANTLGQVVDVLRREWQSDPVRAVLLDLRDCPGGLLDVAVAISTIFLPENVTVLRTAGRLPEANFLYKAGKEYYQRRPGPDPLAGVPPALKTVPVAVLVDAGTASGAEIVAAALQDHRRAVVVGRKTFGRGSIQTVRPLGPTDAVKVTTALWMTPNGKSIHRVGVTPDVEAADVDAVQAATIKLLGQ